MLAGLHAAGFVRCTPIQALTLPVALAGRDVAGQAQTGTGKTAAFLVAVLNRLLTKPAMADRKSTDPPAQKGCTAERLSRRSAAPRHSAPMTSQS